MLADHAPLRLLNPAAAHQKGQAMTTTTMGIRCDWCAQPAIYQLSQRARFGHTHGSFDACSGHRGLLTRLLAEFGGEISTTTGETAGF
jgi:hypothetical protein